MSAVRSPSRHAPPMRMRAVVRSPMLCVVSIASSLERGRSNSAFGFQRRYLLGRIPKEARHDLIIVAAEGMTQLECLKQAALVTHRAMRQHDRSEVGMVDALEHAARMHVAVFHHFRKFAHRGAGDAGVQHLLRNDVLRERLCPPLNQLVDFKHMRNARSATVEPRVILKFRGRPSLIIEDSEASDIAQLCAHQRSVDGVPKDFIYMERNFTLRNISSVAFGSDDLSTVYMGSLMGESIYSFEPLAKRLTNSVQ